MLCPNCDSILNAIGCQGCGWKHGDPTTRNEMANPRKMGREYGSAQSSAEPQRYVPVPGAVGNPKVVDSAQYEKLQAADLLAQQQIEELKALLRTAMADAAHWRGIAEKVQQDLAGLSVPTGKVQ